MLLALCSDLFCCLAEFPTPETAGCGWFAAKLEIIT
jgi:hypothetical protein